MLGRELKGCLDEVEPGDRDLRSMDYMDLGYDLNITEQQLGLFEYVNNLNKTEAICMVNSSSKNREQEDQMM